MKTQENFCWGIGFFLIWVGVRLGKCVVLTVKMTYLSLWLWEADGKRERPKFLLVSWRTPFQQFFQSANPSTYDFVFFFFLFVHASRAWRNRTKEYEERGRMGIVSTERLPLHIWKVYCRTLLNWPGNAMCLHIMESNSLCSSIVDVYVLTSVCVYIRMRFFFLTNFWHQGKKRINRIPKVLFGWHRLVDTIFYMIVTSNDWLSEIPVVDGIYENLLCKKYLNPSLWAVFVWCAQIRLCIQPKKSGLEQQKKKKKRFPFFIPDTAVFTCSTADLKPVLPSVKTAS